jgi:hypothetical protein
MLCGKKKMCHTVSHVLHSHNGAFNPLIFCVTMNRVTQTKMPKKSKIQKITEDDSATSKATIVNSENPLTNLLRKAYSKCETNLPNEIPKKIESIDDYVELERVILTSFKGRLPCIGDGCALPDHLFMKGKNGKPDKNGHRRPTTQCRECKKSARLVQIFEKADGFKHFKKVLVDAWSMVPDKKDDKQENATQDSEDDSMMLDQIVEKYNPESDDDYEPEDTSSDESASSDNESCNDSDSTTESQLSINIDSSEKKRISFLENQVKELMQHMKIMENKIKAQENENSQLKQRLIAVESQKSTGKGYTQALFQEKTHDGKKQNIVQNITPPATPSLAPSTTAKVNEDQDGFTQVVNKRKKVKSNASINELSARSTYAQVLRRENFLKKLQKENPEKEIDTKIKFVVKQKDLKYFTTSPADIVGVSFVKFHVTLNPLLLKHTETYKEKCQIANQYLTLIGVKSKVIRYSMIGKSVLEIYVAKPVEQQVKNAFLEGNPKCIIKNFDPMDLSHRHNSNKDPESQIVNRLATLVYSSPFKKLTECMLEGFPQHIQDKVLKLVNDRKAKAGIDIHSLRANFLADATNTATNGQDNIEMGEDTESANDKCDMQDEDSYLRVTPQV